jgi:hypothetical protein
MQLTRLASKLFLLSLVLGAVFASGASGAEGISSARSLGPTKDAETSSAGPKLSKDQLLAGTQSPAAGQTVSGSIAWQVWVSGGTATRVDFSVDGSVKWSQTSSPYVYGGPGGVLDTTQLSNGTHTLSATAYGTRGSKATTSVSVTVANAAPETAPEPAPEFTPEAPTEATSGGPIYWGATIGSQLTGNQAPWDMGAVSKFEEETRKKVSLVQFFQPFANCNPTCSFYAFPTSPMESIRLHGSIPVLSWSSQSIPSTMNEPDFQLSDVISGRYDAYIREFATKAKAWGHPFFLRFNWEMNGKWFPWHEGVNGNNSGEAVKAWRHVHDIFTSVGTTNATWVWCPNVEYSGSTPLSTVYPGDAYVDWVGLDGYNWGTNPSKPDKWKTFDQVYRSTYRYITETLAPNKPMMIGEVASSEYGGSKATWIREMLTTIPTAYPKVRALLWFDKFDSNMDWPIETSATATGAFAESIKSSTYVGNTFSSLSASAIQPAG